LRTVISARDTESAVNSAIEKFFTRTARLEGRSRRPWHSGQRAGDM
jgi:hypothetical protein